MMVMILNYTTPLQVRVAMWWKSCPSILRLLGIVSEKLGEIGPNEDGAAVCTLRISVLSLEGVHFS